MTEEETKEIKKEDTKNQDNTEAVIQIQHVTEEIKDFNKSEPLLLEGNMANNFQTFLRDFKNYSAASTLGQGHSDDTQS